MPDLPREGAKNHKHEHTVILGPGCGWTMYPGPMLNVWDQHSQSGLHGIPQELVCLLLPGKKKKTECLWVKGMGSVLPHLLGSSGEGSTS